MFALEISTLQGKKSVLFWNENLEYGPTWKLKKEMETWKISTSKKWFFKMFMKRYLKEKRRMKMSFLSRIIFISSFLKLYFTIFSWILFSEWNIEKILGIFLLCLASSFRKIFSQSLSEILFPQKIRNKILQKILL